MLKERITASYRRALNSQFGPGESVTIRRLSGVSAGDYQFHAWITTIQPSDVVGSVQQIRRKAIILADDIADVEFALPFLPKQDRLIWGEKTLTVTAIDDGSRRVQGDIIAYELHLSGA